jgi:FkbM family methyltransferase
MRAPAGTSSRPARAAAALLDDLAGAAFDACFRARALPRMALLRTYLRLKLRRLLREKVLRRPIRSERILGAEVALRDHAAFTRMVREIFLRQIYHFDAARPDPRILDCGGNIGLATIFLKRVHPRARVTVFEPDPANFSLLRRNLDAARLDGVEAVQAALAGAAGELDFARETGDAEGVNAALAAPSAAGAGDLLKVRALTLSSFVDGEIDFLKMDIEGAEEEVLRELAAAGRLRHVARMAVEYHHHREPGRDRLAGFLALLEENGFGYRLLAAEGAEDPADRQDVLIQAWRKARR